MPWEIVRTAKFSADGRLVDVFHKGGGIDGYFTSIILIPEFNIGLTIMHAGSYHPHRLLRDPFLKIVGTEVEKLMRAEGQKKYAGTYKAASSIDSFVELTMDNGSGLRIKSWVSNGVDFLATYHRIKEPYWLLPSDELRLIPSNMDRGADTEVWRVQPSSKKESNPDRVFDDFYMPHLDYFMYFNKPADEFVFKSENDVVKSIVITGLRVELFKML